MVSGMKLRPHHHGDSRDRSCPAPFVERLISVSRNLFRIAEQLQTSGVLLDLVYCAVEL